MRAFCIATFAFLPFAHAAQAGDISGQVTVPAVSARPQSKARPYYGGGKPAPAAAKQSPAVVWIEGTVPGAPSDGAGKKATLAQKGQSFVPPVLPVLKGTTVAFPNQDSEAHNIFSRSETKSLELGRYGPGQSKDVVFDKPGVIKLRCEIHSSMQGLILVLENPFYQVVDGSGAFTLKGVPAGKYKVVAFQEDCEPAEQSVDVPASGEVRQDFSLSAE